MRQPTSFNTSENELAAIRQELNELRPMRQELNELRKAFTSLRGNGNAHYNGNGTSFLEAAESSALTDRRGMLRKVGALAAGIAAASFLRPANANAAARSSSSLDGKEGIEGGGTVTGDPVSLGNTNTASGTDRTSIFHQAADLSPTVFRVANHDGSTIQDPPNSDHTAILANINNNGSMTTTGNLYALFALATTPAGGTSIGVHGEGDDIGVEGIAGANNCGVAGFSDGGTGSHAVDGTSDIGVGGAFEGGRAALFLRLGTGAVADPNATVPSGSSSGDLYRGTAASGLLGAGSLWYRTGGALTPVYRRLADQTTAGALSLLDVPLRLVDTRTGSGFFDAGNHFGTNSLRTYNIVTLAAGQVPDGARGIFGRATVVNSTTASGVLQESPHPPPMMGSNDLGPGTAIINYAVGQIIGATFLSALSDTTDPVGTGRIRVHSSMASGTVDVLIDIVGYFY